MRRIVCSLQCRGKAAPAAYIGPIGLFYILLLSFVFPAPLNAKTLRISLPPKGEVSQRVKRVKKGIVVVKVVGTFDLTQFRAWLNGREVTTAFDNLERRRKWHRKARLSASDGLIQGSNLLEVEVTSEAGESIKDSRTFEVVAGRPLVGAGTDRIVRPGESIRLDGSDSVSTAPLRYRWKLARAPDSSQASLFDGDTRSPLLVPDVPGTYEIRLRVSDGNHRSGRDTVILHATAQPLAVKLNTITTDSAGQPGIQVGDEFYRNAGAKEGLGIQVLILNRSTLEETEDRCPRSTERGNCSITTDTELEKLEKIIDRLDRWERMVILTRSLDTTGMAHSEADRFNHIVEKLGGEHFSTEDLERNTMAISLVGVPGFSRGEGTQAVRGSNTGIEGNLMLNSAAAFWAFTWTDYRSFTVNIGGPGEIVVGGKTFPLGPWDGSGGGFHMLQLDPATLAVHHEGTFQTHGSRAAAHQSEMCNQLRDAIRLGNVTFIASFGAPYGFEESRSFPLLTCIVQQIEGLGGSAHVAAQLKSGKGYALAARGVRPREVAFEASNVITLPGAPSAMKARLNGVLGRNRQGWFEPVAADSTGELGFEMFEIVYQSPTPWPNSSTTGDQGALCYITQQLGIRGTEDVRSLYPDTQGFQPNLGKLNDVQFPSSEPTCGGHSFTKGDFDGLKAQLVIEFSDVMTIRNWFSNEVKVPFQGSNAITEFVELNVIADEIVKALQASDDTDFVVNILGVVGDVLSMIAAVLPILGGQDGENGDVGGGGAAVGVISGLIWLGADIAQLTETGQPVDRIRAKKDQLETALVNSTKANLAAFDRFQELIVSDWGKMRTVAGKALDPNEWLFTDQDLEQAIAAYDRGAKFHFWSALMGAIYQRFEIPPGGIYDPVDHRLLNPVFHHIILEHASQIRVCFFSFTPFGLSKDAGNQWLWSGFVQGGPHDNLLDYLNVWAIMPPGSSVDRWCVDTVSVPPRDLIEKVRKLPEDGGPGLYMPWFWNEFEWWSLQSWQSGLGQSFMEAHRKEDEWLR